MKLTIGSLFTGLAGLDLGLEQAGLGPVLWQCEIDPYCRSVLAKHYPDVTRYTDVRTLDLPSLPRVDVLCGGFPCQGTSDANLNKPGLDHGLSGLWSCMRDVAAELRPRAVVVENVYGLARRGLDTVVSDLDVLGYTVEATAIDGSHVGAPFKGTRLLVVATSHADREPASAEHEQVAVVPQLAGAGGHWRQPPPEPQRVDDGLPGRVDLLKATRALGNAVVPAHGVVAGLRVLQLLGLHPKIPSL